MIDGLSERKKSSRVPSMATLIGLVGDYCIVNRAGRVIKEIEGITGSKVDFSVG